MLFMIVLGEEKGLFGFYYYILYLFWFLNEMVIDLNVDMIGCCDIVYENISNYVYIIGLDMFFICLYVLNE